MDRLTAFTSRRRRLVAFGWLLLAIAGGWAASSIGDALSQSFDAPGRPAFEANRTIAQRFGNGGRWRRSCSSPGHAATVV